MSDPGLLVLRATREHLTVADGDGRPVAALWGRRAQVVVGDRVEAATRNGGLHAVRVLPRRTMLRRRGREGERLLAANVDRLVIVTSVGSRFRPGLVDRMLVAAEVDGIVPLVVVNKADLPEAAETLVEAEHYRDLGYEVLPTSAVSGAGIDALATALAGRVSVLAGHSGVGKSSLLNRLAPDAARSVAAVNPVTRKGRHTTSVAGAYPFRSGVLIDLPGIREFGLAGVEPRRLAQAMPDLRAFTPECRFADCVHEVEPDCAVRAAVDAGRIAAARHESYLRMLESVRDPDSPTRQARSDSF